MGREKQTIKNVDVTGQVAGKVKRKIRKPRGKRGRRRNGMQKEALASALHPIKHCTAWSPVERGGGSTRGLGSQVSRLKEKWSDAGLSRGRQAKAGNLGWATSRNTPWSRTETKEMSGITG